MNMELRTKNRQTGRIALAVVAAVIVFSLPGMARAASYVKLADEWGTIQPTGARAANNGNRFWNVQGGSLGANADSGTLRFYMDGLVSQLNADFPGGWQINQVTLVLEHDDFGGSTAGGVSAFHFTKDDVAITNGQDGGTGPDAPPGNFGALGLALTASTLIFDDTGTAGGQPVRVVDFAGGSANPADLGTVTRVNDYNFSATGDGNIDVLGTPGSLVDPAGATDATPNYTINLPDANTDDTLATFTTELAADSGDWIPAGLDTIIADIESGTDALSFILAATDAASTVVATYKGNPFVPSLFGDYNGDRVVNAADYTVWRDTLGSTTDLRANGDNTAASMGVIDQADYVTWQTRFGNVGTPVLMSPRIYIEASAILAGGAVPEPASAMLLVLGVAGLWFGRRAGR